MTENERAIRDYLSMQVSFRKEPNAYRDPVRALVCQSIQAFMDAHFRRLGLEGLAIVVIRGMSCRTSLIRRSGHTPFIIFDLEYLDHVHRLTNFDVEGLSLGHPDVIRYNFMTDLAAEFLARGFPLEATSVWMEAYRLQQASGIAGLTGRKATKKSRIILQSKYILYHELAHYLLKTQSQYIDLDAFDSLIDDALAFAGDDAVLHATWPATEAVTAQFGAEFQRYKAFAADLLFAYAKGGAKREEFYCDCFALFAVMNGFPDHAQTAAPDMIELLLELERSRSAIEERYLLTALVNSYQFRGDNEQASGGDYPLEGRARAILSSHLIRNTLKSVLQRLPTSEPDAQVDHVRHLVSTRFTDEAESFARSVTQIHMRLAADFDWAALTAHATTMLSNGMTELNAKDRCLAVLDYIGSSEPVIDILWA